VHETESFCLCQNPLDIAEQLETLIPGYAKNPAPDVLDEINGDLVGDPEQLVWFYTNTTHSISTLTWLFFIRQNIYKDDFDAILRWANRLFYE
jgi:hypothetical protein